MHNHALTRLLLAALLALFVSHVVAAPYKDDKYKKVDHVSSVSPISSKHVAPISTTLAKKPTPTSVLPITTGGAKKPTPTPSVLPTIGCTLPLFQHPSIDGKQPTPGFWYFEVDGKKYDSDIKIVDLPLVPGLGYIWKCPTTFVYFNVPAHKWFGLAPYNATFVDEYVPKKHDYKYDDKKHDYKDDKKEAM